MYENGATADCLGAEGLLENVAWMNRPIQAEGYLSISFNKICVAPSPTSTLFNGLVYDDVVILRICR